MRGCEVMRLSCCGNVVSSFSSYYDMRNEPCVLYGIYHEPMLCYLPKHVCHGLDKRRGHNSAEHLIFINIQHYDSGI